MRYPTCTQVVVQHSKSLGEKRIQVEREIHCKDRTEILRQYTTNALLQIQTHLSQCQSILTASPACT